MSAILERRAEGDFLGMAELAEAGLGTSQATFRAFFLQAAAEGRLGLYGWQAAEHHLRALDALLEGRSGLYDRQMKCFAKGLWAQLRIFEGSLQLAELLVEEQQELVEALGREVGDDPQRYLAFAEKDLHLRQLNLLLAADDDARLERRVDELLLRPDYVGVERGRLLTRLAIGLNERERATGEPVPRLLVVLDEAQDLAREDDGLECLLLRAQTLLRRGDLAGCRRALALADARIEDRAAAPGARHGAARAVLGATLALETGDADPLRAAAAALDRELEGFAERWRSVELRPGGFGILQFDDVMALLGERVRVALALEGPDRGARQGLELLARVQELGSLSRALGVGAGSTSVDEVLGALEAAEEERGLLVYLPSRDRTHVFAADRSGVEHHAIARIDAIERAADAVRAQLEDPRRTPERKARQEALLAELGELVLPDPLRSRLAAWSAVTVVGLDAFGGLPFEALPLDGGRVGTLRAVDHLPSLPVGAALERRRSLVVARDEVRIVADPVGSAEEQPALGAERLRDLARSVPRGERGLVVGADATAESLGAAGGERPRVLVVAAHGVRDPRHVPPAGIALAPSPERPDGVLWCEDAAGLTGVAPLVVLATCRAGRALPARGDATATALAGAFLDAGAQAVVLSDYDLDAAAAQRLLAGFLSAIRSGASPAAALRDARAALAGDPRFDDPYHFATLRVVGLGHVALGPGRVVARSSVVAVAVGLGAVMAAVLVLGGRARRTPVR